MVNRICESQATLAVLYSHTRRIQLQKPRPKLSPRVAVVQLPDRVIGAIAVIGFVLHDADVVLRVAFAVACVAAVK